MRLRNRVASGFFAAAILAGCATSQVTSRQQYEGAHDQDSRLFRVVRGLAELTAVATERRKR